MILTETLEPRCLFAQTFYVSPDGSDSNPGTSAAQAWQHVQMAFDAAPAGSTVNVLPGRYKGPLILNASGSASAGYTTFQASGKVILDGTGTHGQPIITINAANYVKLVGFNLTNFTTKGKNGGAALLFEGSGDHVQILNNTVHHTRGFEATAIGIYGRSSASPISNLLVDGNEIYDTTPADSETLTLNGNVTGFTVSHNVIHDTNNIGIDFIGGEGTSVNSAGQADPATDTTRDGICQDNLVYREHASYGGGYGAGIYVDGGETIVIQRNTVDHCDLGIEVGCEHAGRTVTGVTVRDNVLYDNRSAGIAFGGYDASVGRVTNCTFENNTLVHDDTRRDGSGEIWAQQTSNDTIENNILYMGPQNIAINGDTGSSAITSDYNLFFSPKGADKIRFSVGGNGTTGLAAFTASSKQEANSLFGDPQFVNSKANNFQLTTTSPAIDEGDPTFVAGDGETDATESLRVQGGRVDIGAFESR